MAGFRGSPGNALFSHFVLFRFSPHSIERQHLPEKGCVICFCCPSEATSFGVMRSMSTSFCFSGLSVRGVFPFVKRLHMVLLTKQTCPRGYLKL